MVFVDHMSFPENIAKNAALRENVFMMVVCIENRLPLFLVGKPGSSKSLAKAIIRDSMHGVSTTDPLLRNFKEVQLFTYQCSRFSTSESIMEVFKTACDFQKSKKNRRELVSVVVLEEIGLAEDSPGLPLKTLHPFLDDSTCGMEKSGKKLKPEDQVAFIGYQTGLLTLLK